MRHLVLLLHYGLENMTRWEEEVEACIQEFLQICESINSLCEDQEYSSAIQLLRNWSKTTESMNDSDDGIAANPSYIIEEELITVTKASQFN